MMPTPRPYCAPAPDCLWLLCSSTFQASAGGSGTSNELSNSIVRSVLSQLFFSSFSILARASRARSGDAAEHRARGEAGAAGIVEIEQPADQLARGVEPVDRLVV